MMGFFRTPHGLSLRNSDKTSRISAGRGGQTQGAGQLTRDVPLNRPGHRVAAFEHAAVDCAVTERNDNFRIRRLLMHIFQRALHVNGDRSRHRPRHQRGAARRRCECRTARRRTPDSGARSFPSHRHSRSRYRLPGLRAIAEEVLDFSVTAGLIGSEGVSDSGYCPVTTPVFRLFLMIRNMARPFLRDHYPHTTD